MRGRRLVCENHPAKAWPSECECGAGMREPTDWTIKPLLAIDTETTGVNTDEDRIVEIAAVKLDVDGEIVSRWSTLVDPGVDIPVGATAVHGITNARVEAEGVQPADALTHVADLIYESAIAGEPIVIFNATFDLPLLICEAQRHGVDLPIFAPILDPFLIDRLVDREQQRRKTARRESFRYRKGRRQLAMLAIHYGVELSETDAHAAVPDAVAAGRIMRQLIYEFPQIGDRTLAWLWLRQVRGHEADRVRFVDFMRCNRDPDFDKPAGWPIPVSAG